MDVTLVRIPFVAVDTNGDPIRDIAREELTITDDGDPQEIKYLWTEMDLPLDIGLVIDISSSEGSYVRAHRGSVKRFVASVVGPSDRAFLATLDKQPRLLIGWTSSTDQLLRAAEQIRPMGQAGELFGEPCLPPPPSWATTGNGGCIGTAIWDGMFHAAHSQFSRVEVRKAIVLFSDGLDLSSSVHGISSAIEAAQSAGATVYTIKYVYFHAPDLPSRIMRSLGDKGMQDIAAQTGGIAFNQPRNLDKVYRQIGKDLRSQYVLAYPPKDTPVPGTWHHIEIRTTRPRASVRAQASYRVP